MKEPGKPPGLGGSADELCGLSEGCEAGDPTSDTNKQDCNKSKELQAGRVASKKRDHKRAVDNLIAPPLKTFTPDTDHHHALQTCLMVKKDQRDKCDRGGLHHLLWRVARRNDEDLKP